MADGQLGWELNKPACHACCWTEGDRQASRRHCCACTLAALSHHKPTCRHAQPLHGLHSGADAQPHMQGAGAVGAQQGRRLLQVKGAVDCGGAGWREGRAGCECFKESISIE